MHTLVVRSRQNMFLDMYYGNLYNNLVDNHFGSCHSMSLDSLDNIFQNN